MPARKEQPPSGLNGLKKYLVSVAATLTVAILCQTVTLAWWAATVNTRLGYCEKHLDQLSAQVHEMESTHGS